MFLDSSVVVSDEWIAVATLKSPRLVQMIVTLVAR